MRLCRVAAVALITSAVFCFTAPRDAGAAPTVWAVAREPALAVRQALIEDADALLMKFDQARRQTGDRRLGLVHLLQARELLEAGGAADSPDPALRHRLAITLQDLGESGSVAAGDPRRTLERAAVLYASVARSEAASPPMRERAWADLAIVFARLDRPVEEIDAYDHALSLQPDASARARLLGNRAEALMVTGDLTAAVVGYRAALSQIATAPQVLVGELTPTTLWGLAVALDRSGDLAGGLESIVLARAYDPGDRQISGPNWFFVPDYDEAWYHALGSWSAARNAQLDAVRVESYGRAVSAWEEYVERARPDDRWLPIARARLAQCEKEQEALYRKLRVRSPRKSGDEPRESLQARQRRLRKELKELDKK